MILIAILDEYLVTSVWKNSSREEIFMASAIIIIHFKLEFLFLSIINVISFTNNLYT